MAQRLLQQEQCFGGDAAFPADAQMVGDPNLVVGAEFAVEVGLHVAASAAMAKSIHRCGNPV